NVPRDVRDSPHRRLASAMAGDDHRSRAKDYPPPPSLCRAATPQLPDAKDLTNPRCVPCGKDSPEDSNPADGRDLRTRVWIEELPSGESRVRIPPTCRQHFPVGQYRGGMKGPSRLSNSR